MQRFCSYINSATSFSCLYCSFKQACRCLTVLIVLIESIDLNLFLSGILSTHRTFYINWRCDYQSKDPKDYWINASLVHRNGLNYKLIIPLFLSASADSSMKVPHLREVCPRAGSVLT